MILQDYVPDEEVAAVKRGHEKGLFVWGVVSYRDVFGTRHRTTYCQQLYWIPTAPEETVMGVFLDRHNRAN